ncbi:high-affinity choline transporter 1-like isoform X2 [Physella acuta]|uniref:high-affinity choline transporter 1-like isoform X2 n=1 Tax=Physella acuta TaxID=109671 RepID=UPI0027DB6C0E|nr:high-affinity choline transporter 1-like isoform X2 [Physella acuta]
MEINLVGTIILGLIFIVILVVGIFGSKRASKSITHEAGLVANRSLGYFLSTASLTGAFTFVPKMRSECYITIFDPFQLKYGKKVGAILILPHIFGDIIWSAALLATFGQTTSVVLDMNASTAIIMSSSISVTYTGIGGLFSVVYTDVIQLFFIVFGMATCVPFALTHPSVNLSSIRDSSWRRVQDSPILSTIDVCLLYIFGNITWQCIYQRSLSSATVKTAKVSAIVSSVLCLALGATPILLGLAGTAADWNMTSYSGSAKSLEQKSIMALALTYLTPLPTTILGISALASSAMALCDSCVLSSSSILTKNIYADIFRPQATERELMYVLRISNFIIGFLSTTIAIYASQPCSLFALSSDLMYIVLFPQLTLVLWLSASNAYGSLAGFAISLLLRLLCGEPLLNLPAYLKLPFYDELAQKQMFPMRTYCMLMGGLCVVVVSVVTNKLFVDQYLPRKYDFLECYKKRTIQRAHSDYDFDEEYKDMSKKLAMQDINTLSMYL